MAQLTGFLKFVKERESIRLKKEGGFPTPWTKDKIFRTYRFCNIRRADDRVSRWLAHNVLGKALDDSNELNKFLEVSTWCRWVNWPPTIRKVMDAGFFEAPVVNWSKVGRFIDRIEGKKWTGAYMITAPRTAKEKKGLFVAKKVIQGSLRPLVPRLVEAFGRKATCREIWTLLQEQPYFGSFMAGQVVGDWGYTPLLAGASDQFSWAPMGPGSKRGFNRLLRRPLKAKVSSLEWENNLVEWRSAVLTALGDDYTLRSNLTLTALDIQNCLCEYDKYCRVKHKEGRPRAKYRPHTY